MSATDLFVVIRRPVPGNLDQRKRFMTLSCGWSHEVRNARMFNSRAAAQMALGKRPGEVMPLTPEATA